MTSCVSVVYSIASHCQRLDTHRYVLNVSNFHIKFLSFDQQAVTKMNSRNLVYCPEVSHKAVLLQTMSQRQHQTADRKSFLRLGGSAVLVAVMIWIRRLSGKLHLIWASYRYRLCDATSPSYLIFIVNTIAATCKQVVVQACAFAEKEFSSNKQRTSKYFISRNSNTLSGRKSSQQDQCSHWHSAPCRPSSQRWRLNGCIEKWRNVPDGVRLESTINSMKQIIFSPGTISYQASTFPVYLDSL